LEKRVFVDREACIQAFSIATEKLGPKSKHRDNREYRNNFMQFLQNMEGEKED